MKPFGISVAMLTPFLSNGAVNTDLLVAHSKSVFDEGVQGITLYGTTGEGASIGFDERAEGIASVRSNGIDGNQITLGLCGNSIDDVAAQVKQGLEFGVTQFLLLPPFYFKGVSDEGLFDWHAQLFASVDPSAKFILYHIPQITSIPLSVKLVEQLKAKFPERIAGVKDSSGDWDNTQSLLKLGNVPILVGDERLLHRAAKLGAAGSICGMSNLHPARMCKIFETQTEDVALSQEVNLVLSQPVIPALKVLLSHMTDHQGWEEVRSPLFQLNAAQKSDLLKAQAKLQNKEISWATAP